MADNYGKSIDARNRAYRLNEEIEEERRKTSGRRQYTEKDRSLWGGFPYYKGEQIDKDIAARHLLGLKEQEADMYSSEAERLAQAVRNYRRK